MMQDAVYRIGTSPIRVPERADPFVKLLYKTAAERGFSMKYISEKSGVASSTLYGWRLHSSPAARDLEACFNVMGLSLTPVPVGAKA